MTTLAVKNNLQIRQHQSVHAHMRFIISAIGKLDLQTCRIAEPKSLRNRIALYRWSLNDFREALRRDSVLNQRCFPGNSLLKDILKGNQGLIEKIGDAIVLSESSSDDRLLREELNVILVKINLLVNEICETVKLNMVMEDVLAKKTRKY